MFLDFSRILSLTIPIASPGGSASAFWVPKSSASGLSSGSLRSAANADVTASTRMSASGFCALTSLASATLSLRTPVEDSLLTQWTASMSLVTFPSMSEGLMAFPQGTWTSVTSLPLAVPHSMNLFPKEPLLIPSDFDATAFLMDPSMRTVAEPPTRNTSSSVQRAFLIFSTIAPWRALYSLHLCVIIGLVCAMRLSASTCTGPTVKSCLLILLSPNACALNERGNARTN